MKHLNECLGVFYFKIILIGAACWFTKTGKNFRDCFYCIVL